MTNIELGVVKRHLLCSLVRVAASINLKLADENEPTELMSIERNLRAALKALAQMEEIDGAGVE